MVPFKAMGIIATHFLEQIPRCQKNGQKRLITFRTIKKKPF